MLFRIDNYEFFTFSYNDSLKLRKERVLLNRETLSKVELVKNYGSEVYNVGAQRNKKKPLPIYWHFASSKCIYCSCTLFLIL